MTYYSTPPRSDELYHYGIKGMRWGVRRYENKDGSLTELGKKRLKANKEYTRRERLVQIEAKRLLDQDKLLRKKFKDIERAVHEDRYDQDGPGPRLTNEARKRGIDTSRYERAIKDADRYHYDNYRDIEKASQYLRIKNMSDDKYEDYRREKIKSNLNALAAAAAVPAFMYVHNKYKKYKREAGY